MASLGSGDGEPEFQIAPMIDVLLVLLIFFMSITTSQVLKIDKALTLPVAGNATKRDPEMSKHEMAVNCRWTDGKAVLTIDDKIYENRPDVTAFMKTRFEADKQLRIVIRGDKDLPAIEIQRVMDLIGEAGISDIAFAASNK